MVRIRLQRTGAKNNPHYRIVAADSKSPRDGKFIEILGHYHPAEAKDQLVLDTEKVRKWMSKGAMPSLTVANLIKNKKILASI